MFKTDDRKAKLEALLNSNDIEGIWELLDTGTTKPVSFLDSTEEGYSMIEKLSRAVLNENIDEIKRLISEGADVNEKCEDFASSLLFRAFSRGSAEVCKVLLEAGANVNNPENETKDILGYFHSKKENFECAKVVVSSGKVDLTGRSGRYVAAYKQVKAKMEFEEQANKDLARLEAAITNSDTGSIDSFISAKILEPMLEFYSKGYKTKYEDGLTIVEEGCFQDIKIGKFFEDLSSKIVEKINLFRV